jgi:dephospho-CoA kinase
LARRSGLGMEARLLLFPATWQLSDLFCTPMKVFGITGGIGMGKTMSAQIAHDEGWPVVDTDQVARDVVEPSQPALAEIRNAFGAEVIGKDGRLRRDVMARIIFADPEARRRLEAILHPRIRAVWMAQVDAWRREAQGNAFVVIPLLYETRTAAHFDAVICVACSAATQLQRLAGRGWSATEIEQRIKAQIPIGKKMDQANFVIWTEGPVEDHRNQIMRIVKTGGN